jgi:hypothetical protein
MLIARISDCTAPGAILLRRRRFSAVTGISDI